MSVKMTEEEHYKLRKRDSDAQRKRIVRSIDTFPYLMLDVVDFDKAKPECCAMDGKVLRYDDPFWKEHFPPCKTTCLCRVITYTEGMLKRRGLTVEGVNNGFEKNIRGNNCLVCRVFRQCGPVQHYRI